MDEFLTLDKKAKTCPECGKSFLRPCGLRAHYMKHFRTLHTCAVCKKAFTEENDLAVHMKKHSSEVKECTNPNELLDCKHCGIKLLPVKMDLHLKTFHSVSRKFECGECKMQLSCKEDLIFHGKDIHKSVFGKIVNCSLCEMSFSNKSALDDHAVQHKIKVEVID